MLLIEALRQHLLQAPLNPMDETTLQVRIEPGRNDSATSYMWLQRGRPPGQQVVLTDCDLSRAGRVPVRLLGDYAGRLVTDGDEGYVEVVRDNGLFNAVCWAHARRKFAKAQNVQPKDKADWTLAGPADLLPHDGLLPPDDNSGSRLPAGPCGHGMYIFASLTWHHA
jgi:transposase